MELSGKRVLFITTKNIDYIRNSQEIALLQQKAAAVDLLYSKSEKYLFRLIEIYFKLLFLSVKQYDTVFVGFAPQLILPVFGWKFKRKDVIIDFFISVYDTMAFDRKKVKPQSLPGKLCKKVDEVTIKKASYVIADTKAHGNYFCEEFGLDPSRLEVLYLEADTTIYYPREIEKPEHLKDKYVVLYFGSILPLQGIEVIVDAVVQLKDEKDIFFYLIGPVPKEKLESCKNVECIDWLPQDKLAEYIAMADLCLGGHFNKYINKAQRTIPGKVYIYEAMNKPIILGDSAANHELFTEDAKHQFVEMSAPEKLAEKIRFMRQSYQEGM